MWNRGLLKSAMGAVGEDLFPSGVRDSSSLMKLEDEARYVLLPVILQATTSSLSPLLSLPRAAEQQVQSETNQAEPFRSSFCFEPLHVSGGVI